MENYNRKKREQRPRYMGYVTMWNRERNYGFVHCYDDGQSYYVSGKVINEEPFLVKKTVVEFEIGHGEDRDGNPTSYALNLLVAEVPEERREKYGK